jgi:hypothetical protein
MKTFRQYTSTRKIFHADLGDTHPISTKPVWTLEHSRDGAPSHDLAAIEISADGLSARLISHQLPGRVEVSVTLGIEPRTTIRDGFVVDILQAPAERPTLQFSQHRDRGHL